MLSDRPLPVSLLEFSAAPWRSKQHSKSSCPSPTWPVHTLCTVWFRPYSPALPLRFRPQPPPARSAVTQQCNGSFVLGQSHDCSAAIPSEVPATTTTLWRAHAILFMITSIDGWQNGADVSAEIRFLEHRVLSGARLRCSWPGVGETEAKRLLQDAGCRMQDAGRLDAPVGLDLH